MQKESNEDQVIQKYEKYLNFLLERTIKSVEEHKLYTSCTAVFLLIYTVINSLSKLTCSDAQYESLKDNTESAVFDMTRLNDFIYEFFPAYYRPHISRVCFLFSDLLSYGFAYKSVMCRATQYSSKHLLWDSNDKLWINSDCLLLDLQDAISQLTMNIREKGKYYQNAEKRLRANLSVT